MIETMLRKLRQAVKEPLLNGLYNLLVSRVRNFTGRKLFDAQELCLVHRALLSQNLFGIDGKMVSSFEKESARFYGVPYAAASTSGTAAIGTAPGTSTPDIDPAGTIIVHCIERNRSFYKPE